MSPLVFGATGFLGVNLVDALLARGITPRCARRKRSNVIPLRSRKVPLVPADLDDPRSLVEAMAGSRLVYHAAGHYPRLSTDSEAALALGLRQIEHVLDAAAEAGVERLVYVSSTATVAPSAGLSTEADVYPSAPRFGTYHALKWHMEARVLAETRLETIVLCPSGCIGPWDLRVGTSALLVGTARGLCPPHPDGIVNLVDARDVAEALVRAGQGPVPRRLLISGSTHRLHALLESLAERYGVAPPAMPLSAAAAIQLADEEERRAEREGGRPSISREIVDLVVHGVAIDARLAETSLGLTWTPLSDTLDTFDTWARRLGILPGRAA